MTETFTNHIAITRKDGKYSYGWWYPGENFYLEAGFFNEESSLVDVGIEIKKNWPDVTIHRVTDTLILKPEIPLSDVTNETDPEKKRFKEAMRLLVERDKIEEGIV